MRISGVDVDVVVRAMRSGGLLMAWIEYAGAVAALWLAAVIVLVRFIAWNSLSE